MNDPEIWDAREAPDPNPYDSLYCLLWSRSQGHLHIETLGESVNDAMDALMNERSVSDWITLNVGPEGFIRSLAQKLQPEVKARHLSDETLGLVKP